MKKAAQLLAMLIRRWTSKTPKTAKTVQIIMGIVGTAAWVALAIPSLGLSAWLTVPIGLIAYTSTAYEQLKDESNETVIKESRQILKNKD